MTITTRPSRVRRTMLAAALFAPALAHALLVTYASRASFDTAFPASVVETWDGYAAGTTFADGTVAGGITYSTPAADARVQNVFFFTTGPNTLATTDGFLGFGPDNPVTFKFSGLLSAFGIDISTFNRLSGSYVATTDTGETALSSFDPFPVFGAGHFLGFSSNIAFDEVTIATATPVTARFVLDTMRAVPGSETPAAASEPGSLALLVASLLALAAIRRSRVMRARK